MLRKLLKYEIKATARIFLPLFFALLISAGLEELISSFAPKALDCIPVVLSILLYGLIMMGIIVMTFVIMIQRFCNNLLADEGYLMLTLPVKPWKHIVCKLLVSMLWMAASMVVALISLLIIAGSKHIIAQGFSALNEFYKQAYNQIGANVYLVSFELIFASILTIASGILLIYASIAIGHLFSQHKILASIGAYIGLSTIAQILTSLISIIPTGFYLAKFQPMDNYFFDIMPMIHPLIVFGIIITLLLSAGYFALTNFVLCKKLNLE